MNKQEILNLTGLTENEFYNYYPDQESFCNDYPEACDKLQEAQNGIQVYTSGRQLTPTGQNNSFYNNTQNITPEQLMEAGKKYGWRTDNARNFQEDMYKHISSNNPELMKQMINKYGAAKAGFVNYNGVQSFAPDNMLGARSAAIFNDFQKTTAPSKKIRYELLNSPNYYKDNFGKTSAQKIYKPIFEGNWNKSEIDSAFRNGIIPDTYGPGTTVLKGQPYWEVEKNTEYQNTKPNPVNYSAANRQPMSPANTMRSVSSTNNPFRINRTPAPEIANTNYNNLMRKYGGPLMPEYKTGGNWIQSAVKHPGRCTPGSPNYDCPKGSPQWNLAQTFKKHHGFHEEGGDVLEYQNGGVYTIRKGDTLSNIAHNNNISLATLLKYNQSIKNSNLIYPGDKINLINPSNINPINRSLNVTNYPITVSDIHSIGSTNIPYTKQSIAYKSNKVIEKTKSLPNKKQSEQRISNDVDLRHLESGMIEDKNKNVMYVLQNGKVVKTYPIMTGLNKDGNVNNKGVYWLESHPKEALKMKATPVGTYFSHPSSNIYGRKGFRMEPIPAFGQPAPLAKDLAQHVLYGTNPNKGQEGYDPKEGARRTKIMKGPGENRVGSYGCTNMYGQDIDCLTGNLFPQGDTTIVVDTRRAKDAALINNLKYYTPQLNYRVVTNGKYEKGGDVFPAMRNFKHGGYYGMDGKFHKNSDSGTYVSAGGYYFDPGGETGPVIIAPKINDGEEIQISSDNGFVNTWNTNNNQDNSQYYSDRSNVIETSNASDPYDITNNKSSFIDRWNNGKTKFQKTMRGISDFNSNLIGIGDLITNSMEQSRLNDDYNNSLISQGSTDSIFSNAPSASKGDYDPNTGKKISYSNMSFKGMYGKYGMEVPKYAVGGFKPQIETLADYGLESPEENIPVPINYESLYSLPSALQDNTRVASSAVPLDVRQKEINYNYSKPFSLPNPTGKDVATKLNNPGNIIYSPTFSKLFGAVKSNIKQKDGNGYFAAFPSLDAGLKARETQLFGEVDGIFKSKYYNPDTSVDEALKKWSNNGYGVEIYKALKGKTLKEVTPAQRKELMKRQIQKESGKMYQQLVSSGYFKYGGQQNGGQVVEMDENEIQQFLKAGGQLEFLD